MSNIIEKSDDYVFNTTNCECYPNCNHIQYHAPIFTDRMGGQVHNHSFIELDVFFQEETLFSYRSTLHMTFLDLMGVCSTIYIFIRSNILNNFNFLFNSHVVAFGGIAGLILGVSVIGSINYLINRIGCCGKPSRHPA